MELKNTYKVSYVYGNGAITAIAKLEYLDSKYRKCAFAVWALTEKGDECRETFSGTARLKKNDKVDFKTAKRIARCKALRQANRYFANKLDYFSQLIMEKVCMATGLKNSAVRKSISYENEILELARGENK